MDQQKTITVEILIKAPIEKVWEFWTKPEHIVNWAFASNDWEASHAENDLCVGGKFKTVMAAKDKSTSFDFTGVYTNVKENELIWTSHYENALRGTLFFASLKIKEDVHEDVTFSFSFFYCDF